MATFECAANLFDGNNPERTMDVLTTALSPSLVGAGGCNEGFLRDDAVLVVTFITDDEDDDESSGSPSVWHDTLLALKSGNETSIVMLGLVGHTGLPGAICPPVPAGQTGDAEYAPRLIEYVESWGERGPVGECVRVGIRELLRRSGGLDRYCLRRV